MEVSEQFLPLLKYLEDVSRKLVRSEIDAYFAANPVQVRPKTDEEELLTIKDAAIFLNESESSLYTKTSTRKIPFMKKGKRLYFLKSQLLIYMKSGLKSPLTQGEQTFK